MTHQEQLLEDVESLQNILLARAEGSAASEKDYRDVRERLLNDSLISDRLPRFVRTCRSLGQFWPYIKEVDGTYAGRRKHIWEAFAPLLEYLETGARSPADAAIHETLKGLGAADIGAAWQRALHRRSTDPEGAITAARSLLESVCKTILDELSIQYPANPDLPELYHLVAKELKLAPSLHDEDVFKRILGGAKTVVDGLATVRNRYGDSHGKGKNPVRPSPRHAELAVNLAGTIASFLAATFRERGGGSSD